MADSLGSWLAKAIIQHDKEFGANLETPWMGSRYCQLIQVSAASLRLNFEPKNSTKS